jgi:hypothetical protein
MSHGREVHDRRRRVLYSAHQAEQTPAASRRESERLRKARRPPAGYGARVQRRLQGRWFSLVPIRRRTLILVAGLITLLTLLLCGAHYAAVAWPSIAHRPEIARPLRLDRPDSFGRWFTSALLIVSTGASLLIYQLRRYRLDDYHGRYRLWRLVILVFLLAGINSVVALIDWGGALLDAGFGQRVALSGSDWIRLILSLSGAVLALRLAVEVHRSRFALISMLVAFGLLAIPEAVNWNVLKVESLGIWVLVTSAPLLACTALLIALGGYLRSLYREVLKIGEPESVREKFQQLCRQLSNRLDRIATSSDEAASDAGEPKVSQRRGWLSRSKADKAKRAAAADKKAKPKRKSSDDSNATEKRGWFGSRSGKSDKQSDGERVAQDNSPAEPVKKGRRFSMRLAPPTTEKNTAQTAQAASSEAPQNTDDLGPKRKSGIGGWLRRDKAVQADGEHPVQPKVKTKAKPTTSVPAAKSPSDEADDIDTTGIDWNSLSKAERRRVRKQLKRRNRAA